MRLLIVSSEFPPGPGGIGTHAFQLALNLSGMGWSVSVIAPQDYATELEIRAFNNSQPFRIARLGNCSLVPMKLAQRTSAIWKEIHVRQPQVILATGARAVWATAMLSGAIPMVAVGYGSEFGLAGWQHSLNCWAFRQAECVVSISQFTSNIMTQHGIVPSQPLVIPCGADDSHFGFVDPERVQAFRKRLGVDQSSLLIVTVGNVTERKGQHVVIRALPFILHAVPNVHYLIAGLPTMKEQLLALASHLGVADHVHFLGRIPHNELPTLLNACDVFAMTSVNTANGDVEGYGIAAVEAALCGRPAVVSDGSGLAEAVLDKVTGFVVPQNNPEQTAVALIGLLRDRSLREHLGKAARERALAEQTWAVQAKTYDQLLKQIVF